MSKLDNHFDSSVDTNMLPKKAMIKSIHNDWLAYFLKLTNSITMTYLFTSDSIYKISYNKNQEKIMKVWNWLSTFKAEINFRSKVYDDKQYKVILFPDCFLQTSRNNALTEIYHVFMHEEVERKEKLLHNHPFFNGLFTIAWELFTNNSKEHQLIQMEKEIGNATLKIESSRNIIITIEETIETSDKFFVESLKTAKY